MNIGCNILLFPLLLIIISFTISPTNYQYECVTLNQDGYVTIKIWNPQKGKNYKLEQAQKDAIDAILFAGIPAKNGCESQKPLLQKQEEQENFKNIEKEFYKSNGPWARYIHGSQVETTLPETLGTKEWKVYQVSVAKNLLRKYLEEKYIVKPLNSGF